jgi:hypothetical protein
MAALFIADHGIQINQADARNEGSRVTRRRKIIESSRDRGAWAELHFAMRAMHEGLRPARPWGEPSGYDFLVDCSRGKIFRVQVKSTIRRQNSWYQCSVRTCHSPYKKDAFHFLAALVIPEDVWYILPGELVWGLSTLGFNPKLSTEKYHPFKEAWDLLCGHTPGVIPRMDVCTEEYIAESIEEW